MDDIFGPIRHKSKVFVHMQTGMQRSTGDQYIIPTHAHIFLDIIKQCAHIFLFFKATKQHKLNFGAVTEQMHGFKLSSSHSIVTLSLKQI